MPDTPKLRAATYRHRAAELRHLAGAIPPNDVNRQQLLNLADDFEELADSMGRTPLGD
jgi:hypothetical protein